MTGAVNFGDTVSSWTASTSSMCDGAFKSMAHSPSLTIADGIEIGCTLTQSKPIIQVFFQQRASSQERIGETRIMVGTSSTRTDAYQSPIYDSGFFLLPATITGSVISLDSNQSCSGSSIKNYNEIRVYQTPNLFQLDDISVTIQESPQATSTAYAAENLITSLDHRSNTKGYSPYKAGCSQETYETCFVTNRSYLKNAYQVGTWVTTPGIGIGAPSTSTLVYNTVVDDHGLFVLGFDLGASKFQHSVLVVQTLHTQSPHYAEWQPYHFFQNFKIYIGNSSNYWSNAQCAGGPFQTLNGADSYVDVDRDGQNGQQWRFGKEVWCNLEGRYMTIVADFSGVSQSSYEIALCHVAIMGTEYIRDVGFPSSIFMYNDDPAMTLTIDHIISKYTIANLLAIEMRQKSGLEQSFVTITNASPHSISIAPQSTDVLNGYLYFESTDANSNAATRAVLKKDYVQTKVLDSACRPTQDMTLATTFNTDDELEWIVEYEPKIYFPQQIWTGYHTLDGINCYGTYTQTIVMDKTVSGVTLVTTVEDGLAYSGRSYLEISKTATPDQETFTLTFTGTYAAEDGVTTQTETLVQRYKIRNAFSPDFVVQPVAAMVSGTYAHMLAPVDPGTPAEQFVLTQSDFDVLYQFDDTLVDDFGTTPRVFSHKPYGSFSSPSDLVLGEDALEILDYQTGDLLDALTMTTYGPTDPIQYECPGWDVDKEIVNLDLTFQNSFNTDFIVRFVGITCEYEPSIPPSFDTVALELAELITVEALVPSNWTLPPIIEGDITFKEILFTPAEEIAPLLVFDPVTRLVSFTGDEESFDLIGEELVLSLSLVNLWGQNTTYNQTIHMIGCPIVADAAVTLVTSIQDPPIELIFDAGKVGSHIVSYSGKSKEIISALEFDDFKEEYCGELVYELVSPYEFLELDTDTEKITLKSDESSIDGYYMEAFLNVTVATYSWQVPINATFEGCYTESLSFGKKTLKITYNIGSGKQDEGIPTVVQKPNCGEPAPPLTQGAPDSSSPISQVETAVSIDLDASLISIASDDFSLAGTKVTYVIDFDQESSPEVIENTTPIKIQITFQTEPPKFEDGELEVKAITCSESDKGWSIDLPAVAYAAVIGPVEITLLEETDGSKLFTLKNNRVTFTGGDECPATTEVTLEFLLANDLLGENKQTISVPVKDANVKAFEGFKILTEEKEERVQVVQVQEAKEVEKLLVRSLQISATGRLKISFSKPIFTPPFKRVEDESTAEATDQPEQAEQSESVEPSQEGLRLLEEETEEEIYKEIKDAIQISILGAEDEEIIDKSVANVTFVDADESWIAFQVTFSDTTAITQFISDPDTLVIKIIDPEVFIDQETNKPLEKDSLRLSIQLQPQFTQAGLAALQGQAESAATVGTFTVIWQLVLMFALGKALHSMWVLINVLQFLVYISMWQIRYPTLIKFLLFQMRKIALGEFMDDLTITEDVTESIGIPTEKKSATEEKVGEERLGSGSVLSSFGPTLILVSFLCLFLIIVIVILLCLARKYGLPPKVKNLADKIKAKIFWNAIIRYLLLNALKLNMSGFVALKLSTGLNIDMMIAVVIIAMINFVPLKFFFILYNNHYELEDEAFVKKSGTLVLGKRVDDDDHKIWAFPIMFFYRRTLFIIATVYLLDYPFLQMVAHYVLTMLTLAYLAYDTRLFDSRSIKYVEIGSELLLHMFSISLTSFMVQSYQTDVIDQIETLSLILFGMLLSLNIAYVFWVVRSGCKKKSRLKKWQAKKDKHLKDIEEKKKIDELLKRTYGAQAEAKKSDKVQNQSALAPISEREQEGSSSDSSEQSIDLIPGSKIKPNFPIAPAKKQSKAKPQPKPQAVKPQAKPRGKPVKKGPQEVIQTREADVTKGADQSIDDLWREFNAVLSPDLVQWPKSMIQNQTNIQTKAKVNEFPLLITEERQQIPMKIGKLSRRQRPQSPLRISEEVKTKPSAPPIKIKIGILQRGKQ